MSHSPLYQTRATIIFVPATRRRRLRTIVGMASAMIGVAVLVVLSGLAGGRTLLIGQPANTAANSREDESARRAVIDAMATSSPMHRVAALAEASKPQHYSGQYQVVGVGDLGLLLRPEPSTALDPIETLPEGAMITRIGPDVTRDGRQWHQVRDSEGVEGWVAAEYTREVTSTEAVVGLR